MRQDGFSMERDGFSMAGGVFSMGRAGCSIKHGGFRDGFSMR